MERSHAELQRHHNRSVRESPEYRMAGMLDIMHLDWEMNFPTFPEQDTSCMVAQCPLRGRFEGLERRLEGQQCVIAHINNEHHKRKPKRKYKEYREG